MFWDRGVAWRLSRRRRRHWPFAEAQVRWDDDAGSLAKSVQQMGERSTGGARCSSDLAGTLHVHSPVPARLPLDRLER